MMTEEDKALLLKYDIKYNNTDEERLKNYITNHAKKREYHRVKTRDFYRKKAQEKLDQQVEQLKENFNLIRTEEDETKRVEIFKNLINNTKKKVIEKL